VRCDVERCADELSVDNNVWKTTLHTNNYGTLMTMRDLLPLIRSSGRLVNLCSMSGHLDKYSPILKQAFIGASQTSVEACTVQYSAGGEILCGYESQEGDAEGWPTAAYAVSKAGEIAFTKAIARGEEKKRGRC